MAGLNSIQIIGNLGQDPELLTTKNGKPWTHFSVAVNERDFGENITTWFNIVVFGPLAETCAKYLHKGSSAYFSGPHRYRKAEISGREVTVWEIKAREMVMLDGKPQGERAEPRRDERTAGRADAPKLGMDRPGFKPNVPDAKGWHGPGTDDDIPF